MRFDSGFWSGDTLKVLARHGVRYTMAVRTNTTGVAEAIAAIDEAAWVDIDYTPDGQARSRRNRVPDPPIDRAANPAHRAPTGQTVA